DRDSRAGHVPRCLFAESAESDAFAPLSTCQRCVAPVVYQLRAWQCLADSGPFILLGPVFCWFEARTRLLRPAQRTPVIGGSVRNVMRLPLLRLVSVAWLLWSTSLVLGNVLRTAAPSLFLGLAFVGLKLEPVSSVQHKEHLKSEAVCGVSKCLRQRNGASWRH